MSNALIRIGLCIIFVLLISFEIFAQCEGDFDNDGDVDGTDGAVISTDYGRTDCGTSPVCEGEAAYDDIGEAHHETVWSTGFDPADFVFALNERFEVVDPVGFHENNITRDDIYSHAVSGAIMADFFPGQTRWWPRRMPPLPERSVW